MPTPARRIARALPVGLAAGLVLVAVAAGAEERPLDLWPLVVRDARPVAGIEATRIGGPFFEYRRTAPGPGGEPPPGAARWESAWTLRPLAARLERPGASDLELLHPFAGWRVRPDRTRMRVTPFAERTFRTDASADSEGPRWILGPAFGGRTETGERYGGLFPIAGVAKQRFGKERIEFLLFPLFGRSRDESGFVRTHVLWPFFSFGRGGGRELVRFWPFYGRDRRAGEWDRRFALWPFLHWRTERPGEPTEQRVRLVLPFWGESRTAHARSRFVLGPLYMKSEDGRTGAYSLDVAWPFYRRSETPAREGFSGASQLKLEPFFHRRLGPDYERRSFGLGAWDHLRTEREGVRTESLRVFFANRFERVEELATGDGLVRRDVWPLFSRRERIWHDADGGFHRAGRLHDPWPLPISGESFQRNALGLLTLYERRWMDGETRSDWLHGLARHREAAGYRLDAVSWLYRRVQEGEAPPQRRILGIPVLTR